MFTETKFSRLLIYQDTIDDILGIIHRKDFYVGRGITEKEVKDIISPAIYVLESEPIRMILKKQQTADSLKTEVWQTEVVSYTKDASYRLTLAKNYISDEDHVLIVDDFLANGEAATGAIRLIRKAHATVAGLGVLIEKTFQPGREKLESQGIHVYAQASIKAFENGKVVF